MELCSKERQFIPSKEGETVQKSRKTAKYFVSIEAEEKNRKINRYRMLQRKHSKPRPTVLLGSSRIITKTKYYGLSSGVKHSHMKHRSNFKKMIKEEDYFQDTYDQYQIDEGDTPPTAFVKPANIHNVLEPIDNQDTSKLKSRKAEINKSKEPKESNVVPKLTTRKIEISKPIELGTAPVKKRKLSNSNEMDSLFALFWCIEEQAINEAHISSLNSGKTNDIIQETLYSIDTFFQ